MQSRFLNLAAVSFGLAGASLALASGAQAHESWHHHHHYRAAYNERPLTVTKHHHHYYATPVAAAPDPWHGPAPVVTGPNYVAASIVGLPFRAVNSIFPAYGDPGTNPLILVGAPVHVLAQVVEFPFYVVGSAFGAPPPITY
jgi:hypothetical protein